MHFTRHPSMRVLHAALSPIAPFFATHHIYRFLSIFPLNLHSLYPLFVYEKSQIVLQTMLRCPLCLHRRVPLSSDVVVVLYSSNSNIASSFQCALSCCGFQAHLLLQLMHLQAVTTLNYRIKSPIVEAFFLTSEPRLKWAKSIF